MLSDDLAVAGPECVSLSLEGGVGPWGLWAPPWRDQAMVRPCGALNGSGLVGSSMVQPGHGGGLVGPSVA